MSWCPFVGATLPSLRLLCRQHRRTLGVLGGLKPTGPLPAAEVLIPQALQLCLHPSLVPFPATLSTTLCCKYLEQLAPKLFFTICQNFWLQGVSNIHKNPIKYYNKPPSTHNPVLMVISSQPILLRFYLPIIATTQPSLLPHTTWK